jgi:hypothetical protein
MVVVVVVVLEAMVKKTSNKMNQGRQDKSTFKNHDSGV